MARWLAVVRNTVLAAYDDLAADDLIRGRRGAGMLVTVTALADPDGNPMYVNWTS
jgi:DNA-binding transcriptional regulator YhcF (GntR family)